MENRVVNHKGQKLIKMLDILTPKIEISTVKIGKNFQFAGDRYVVRHVVDVDGEYVLLKTFGNLDESGHMYVVHYSHLWPNESPIWDDDNKFKNLYYVS